jgi:hypothetical protein
MTPELERAVKRYKQWFGSEIGGVRKGSGLAHRQQRMEYF